MTSRPLGGVNVCPSWITFFVRIVSDSLKFSWSLALSDLLESMEKRETQTIALWVTEQFSKKWRLSKLNSEVIQPRVSPLRTFWQKRFRNMAFIIFSPEFPIKVFCSVLFVKQLSNAFSKKPWRIWFIFYFFTYSVESVNNCLVTSVGKIIHSPRWLWVPLLPSHLKYSLASLQVPRESVVKVRRDFRESPSNFSAWKIAQRRFNAILLAPF